MAARKTSAPAAQGSPLEIGSIYEQELQKVNENLKRQAALSMFQKLQPNNKTTVDQFLAALKQHKEVWSIVANMGIVEFADAINDGRRLREGRGRQAEARGEGKRTRLNEQQKQALKGMVVSVLADAKEGYTRHEIARNIGNEQILNWGVARHELANKLRQPLAELVSENKIYTVGEKRLLRYLHGSGAKNRKG